MFGLLLHVEVVKLPILPEFLCTHLSIHNIRNLCKMFQSYTCTSDNKYLPIIRNVDLCIECGILNK